MNVNDPRWASIDAFVEENRDNILRDITRLVTVPSVEGAPEPGAPFGPGPKPRWPSAGDRRRAGPGHLQRRQLHRLGRDGQDRRRPEVPGDHHPHRRCARGQRLGRRPLHGPRAGRLAAGPRRGRRQRPQHPLPVRAEVPEGQRRGAEIPRACPAGCQRGDEHARRRLLRRALPDARLLLYAGRRVPGLQRREGRLQRRARQPEV